MIQRIKIQKTFGLILKLLLFIGVTYFFFLQIKKLSIEHFSKLSLSEPIWLILAFLLFFLNWGLELLKWKKILTVNQLTTSLKILLSSLLSGISTGVITPNRIGNFIGRMLYFKGKIKAQIILGTLYANFAQFLATLLFGALSLFFISELVFEHYTSSLSYITAGVLLFSLVFYFLTPYLNLSRIRWTKSKQNIIEIFQNRAKELSLPILLLSMGRYLTFVVQYLCFFLAFGVPATWELINGIFLFYLISSLIPSIFIGKILVRETVGLFVLGLFIDNSAIIVISSLLLWILNLGIPSLIGLFFVLKKK